MASARPKFQAPVRSQPHFLGFTPSIVTRWAPSLALWGAGAAVAVSLYMSPVPIFQRDVLKKIPFVASYYEDKTPDSDKPF